MHVDCYTEGYYFFSLGEEWDNLVKNTLIDNIFLTRNWNSIWWNHFGRGKKLLLLTLRDKDSVLNAIIPFFRYNNSSKNDFYILGEEDVCDYSGIIIYQGKEEEVWVNVIKFFNDKINEWNTINIRAINEDSPTLLILPSIAAKNGYLYSVEKEDICATISHFNSWEEFLLNLKRKDRHELKRKLRKAEKYHELKSQGFEDCNISESLEIFFKLFKKGRKSGFMTDTHRNFFSSIATNFSTKGWIEIPYLLFDSIPIAALFCFNYKNTSFVYNSAYDPDFSFLSPGILLLSKYIYHSILNKRKIDMLRGDEKYKFAFGASSKYIYRIVISRNKR